MKTFKDFADEYHSSRKNLTSIKDVENIGSISKKDFADEYHSKGLTSIKGVENIGSISKKDTFSNRDMKKWIYDAYKKVLTEEEYSEFMKYVYSYFKNL